MRFKVIKSNFEILKCGVIYLCYIHYDDYGYCTSYNAYAKPFDDGSTVYFGKVKIGYRSLSSKVGQGASQNGFASYSVNDIIPKDPFSKLSDEFFSLGQNIQYYKGVNDYFQNSSSSFYESIKDIAYDFKRFEKLYSNREACLINSLMRDIHYPNVEQFSRISKGDAELTRYNFSFNYYNNTIDFKVDPNLLPPSNIHVLIGRNGVGKTWLLYHMVCRILETMDINADKTQSTKYTLHTDFVLDDMQTRLKNIST